MNALDILAPRAPASSSHLHQPASACPRLGLALVLALVGISHPALAADTTHACPTSAPVVQWWTSSEDLQARMTLQPDLQFRPGQASSKGGIHVDDKTTYQSMLGLGSSLEHSTCYNLPTGAWSWCWLIPVRALGTSWSQRGRSP